MKNHSRSKNVNTKIVAGILILLLSFSEVAVCLQCYSCTYSKLLSDNSILNFLLGAFNKISDIHCKLANHEDYREIAIRNCPVPQEGYLAKCANLKGTVTASIGVAGASVSFDYETIERSCVEVQKSDSGASNGCHTELPANSVSRKVLDKTFSGLNLGDISFDGKICYGTSTVPVPSLQCTRCTWNDVETSNFFINTVINGLEDLSSNNCKFENLNKDKYEVNLRNCPAAPSGYVTKCGSITGKIKATKELLGVDHSVIYITTQRDCINVPGDGYAYTNGCHSDLPANGPTRALLLETFGSLGLGDIQFDGKACYDNEVNTQVASKQTSAASKNYMNHMQAFITIILVIYYLK